MRKIRLGRTGVNVSPVALGSWSYGGPTMNGDIPVGWTGHDDTRASAALVRAWERGITHWDTADAYGEGRSERLIGTVWDTVDRADVFLASKVGWMQGPYPHYYHPDQMRGQIEATLQNLRVECVDLYYLHHCYFGDDDLHLDGALESMHRFRDEGKTRFLGLSDWDLGKVAARADRVQPDVVQVYRNVRDDAYATSGLRAWVESHDAGVVFFSPLKQGLLLGKYDAPPTFGAGDVRGRVEEFTNAPLITSLREAAVEVRRRFADRPEPVLHALVESLLTDAPTGCTLVGLRSPEQVDAAVAATAVMDEADAHWVFDLYRPRGVDA